MKYVYLLAIGLLSGTAVHAQKVITYGKHQVMLEEVMKAYHRNQIQSESTTPLPEYLSLFADFKLKVQAAKDERFDTLSNIQQDIRTFRDQLAETYMQDEASFQKLFQEALERCTIDLDVIYFHILNTDANNTEPLDRMNALHKALSTGNTNYAQLASQNSSNQFKVQCIPVGFITVFSLPYSHENVVYGLKDGEVSAPFTTASGVHLYKVIKRRKHIGNWKIAQILIATPPFKDAELEKAALEKAQLVYQKLQNGEVFSNLALTYSDDKFTYTTGGELPMFSTGKFSSDFEEKVLSLKADGDYTSPFRTEMGYHIVKRLEHYPTDTASNPYRAMIKDKLMKDNRMKISKDIFWNHIVKTTKLKVNPSVPMSSLLSWADSVRTNNNFKLDDKSFNAPVLTLEKKQYYVKDWLQFVPSYVFNYTLYKGEQGEDLWNKFVEVTTRNYYKDNLEKYNSDFKYQMLEFTEGNLLFEVMEKYVWGKAVEDTIGLKAFYEANKEKYIWEESADMLLFHVSDMKEAETIQQKIKDGIPRWQIENEHPYILTDSGRFEIQGYYEIDNFIPQENEFTPMQIQEDKTVTFTYLLKLYPAGGQKSLEDGKGLVIHDYQLQLEKEWVAELRKKYPVKLHLNNLPKK